MTNFAIQHHRRPRRSDDCRAAMQRERRMRIALRCMLSYAVCRLQRSKGRPVSLNQTAMAQYFAQHKVASGRKRVFRSGPSRRTVIRAWLEFTSALRERGFLLERVHSVGVGANGKRRKGTRQRKLGWICYSVQWKAAGNKTYRHANERADAVAAGSGACRWNRNENGALLVGVNDPQESSVPILPPVPHDSHSVSIVVPYFSSEFSEKNLKKHNRSNLAGQVDAGDRPPELIQPSKPPKWRVPWWVRNTIWGLSRQRLGRQAEPLAFRAFRLWNAGMAKITLFALLERAADFGREAETGYKGAIAAAFLARLVMKTKGPLCQMPTNEDFDAWLNSNTLSMRGKTARRCIDYEQGKKQRLSVSLPSA